jgi:hypothetical protein
MKEHLVQAIQATVYADEELRETARIAYTMPREERARPINAKNFVDLCGYELIGQLSCMHCFSNCPNALSLGLALSRSA